MPPLLKLEPELDDIADETSDPENVANPSHRKAHVA